MKRFILAVLVGLFSLTAFAQGVLAYTLKTDYLSKWDKTTRDWGSNFISGAHFEVYCTDNGTKATKIVAYMDSTNSYTVSTTFYVYEQVYVDEDGGFSYYVYVYTNDEKGTAHAYDKTEFIKVQFISKGRIITIQLKGYNSDSYQWNVKKFNMK
jgi:hypothetical protein